MGLHQINHTPTCGEAILDVLLTNKPGLVTKTTTIPGLGDHDIVLIDSLLKARKTRPVARTVSIWKEADWDAIRKDTRAFSDHFSPRSDLTVEEQWTEVHHHLTSMMEKYVPTKKCSTRYHQPWINNKLKRHSRRKNRAWKKAKKSNKPEDWSRYREVKKETRRQNRQAYQQYVNSFIQEDSAKNLWRYVKSRKCDHAGVAPLTKDGLTYSDSSIKADILNDQFCSVFTDENLASMPTLGASPHPNMPDIMVAEEGIRKLLHGLNPKKAAGPDGIPCRLLQAIATELAPALTSLFRTSLQSGQIPKAWKHALVQPVFKKGDRSKAGNYRPISLTCICCKLLEHVIRHEISEHLDRREIISDAQHGFRKRRSCVTQLITTVDDLSKELEAKGQMDTILLDFAKAFDKVPHERLLLKLHFYGIRGQTLNWIGHFLSERTQQVVVEGKTSGTGNVTSGVPQGSVLGPTLFLIFINDLGNNIKSKIRLFADDTALYNNIKSVSDQTVLQEDLKTLEKWEEQWQMQFNVEKCHVLSVTDKLSTRISPNYKLHNQTLEEVQSAKYLGVELTNKLNWGQHIANITAKANRTSAFVYRNLKGCPIAVQTHCYKSLVRPLLEYASPVWDPHQEGLSDRVEKIQGRAARRILHDFSWETRSATLVRKLNLETLRERRKIDKVTALYKILNGLVDMKPPPEVVLTKSITRGAPKKITYPQSDKDTNLYSFYPSAIRLWRDLPPQAWSPASLTAFKSALQGGWAVDK